MEEERARPILLIDGVCNLCNGTVRFVADREREPLLRFASLQSEFGRALLTRFGLPSETMESLVLVEDGQLYRRSDAALRLCRYMKQPWASARYYIYIPRFLRDAVYNFIAQNRYRWFGRQDQCTIPRADLAPRFLDET
ncbi:MAG TPA: DCC1-like thiol-disulfide oxidoreductase family protein [Candidatus Krumholzibacteria bacterium]|jgi:predicted DCC family thiol-disulfide oxidoreductase YuxK